MLNPLTNHILYKLLKTFLGVLGRLPAGMRNAFAVILGRLFYALDANHRQVALANLERVFGKEKTKRQRRILALQVCENLCRIPFELAWALRLKEKEYPRHFSIKGLTYYHQALKRGKGVLLLSAHFGNWELMSIIMYMARIPVRAIYRPIDLPFADRFFKELRTRLGTLLIPTRTGAMRRLYRALRNGYPVGMLIDQSEGWRQGVYAEFFGHMTCTNPGMAMLALKTGATVVPVFLVRASRGFRAEFCAPLTTIRTGDTTLDVQENTRLYNKIVESYILRHPDQWFWVHNRWKTPVQCRWPDPERKNRWYRHQNRRAAG